jgi:hypothetical protein
MRMRLGTVALLFVAMPAVAIPPPPSDGAYEDSVAAIATLTPFLGDWHGKKDVPGPHRIDQINSRRTVTHLASAISFVAAEDQPQTLMAITASSRGELSLSRIGFAPFRATDIETVPLERPTPQTLRWTMSAADARAAAYRNPDSPLMVRVTVEVVGNIWRERQEYMEGSKTTMVVELTLARQGK